MNEKAPGFAEQLVSMERLIGTFLNLPCERVTEIIGYGGFDFAIIDTEHSPIGPTEVESLIRAADARGLPIIVRLPDLSASPIARALDSGAAGVLAPQIRHPDEAREVVRAANYHPVGRRGLGVSRAANYGIGDLSTYFATVRVAVGIQIETREAVAAIDVLSAIDGIDLFFVGPLDLSQALGIPGILGAPELEDTITEILLAVKAAGGVAGIAADTADEARARLDQGFQLVTVASDAGFLVSAARSAVSRLRMDSIVPVE